MVVAAMKRPRPHCHLVAFRTPAPKLRLAEGRTHNAIAEELGIGRSTLGKWLQRYRAGGEAGLMPTTWAAGR